MRPWRPRSPRGLAHAVGNPLGEQPAITDGLDAKAITDLEARVMHRHLGQSDAPLAPDPGFSEARGRRSAGMPRRLGWGREDSNLRRLSRCVYSALPLTARALPREGK